MRISNFLICAIWLGFIFQAIMQGLNIPKPIIVNNQNIELMAPPVLLPISFLFFLLAAFFQRKSKIDFKFIKKYIDNYYGNGAFENFLTRLKPITLFMIGLLVLGVTGMFATFVSTKETSAYYHAGFFLSGGMGLLSAYILSIKYPPRLE